MASAAAPTAQKPRSVFDLPPDFFDSCRLFDPSDSSVPPPPLSAAAAAAAADEAEIAGAEADAAVAEGKGKEVAGPRLTCNICKAEFESLQDQRDHFKSDVHRLNVKLSIAGKKIVKEDDFDELGGDSLFEDNDVSSISGSEDEFDKGSMPNSGISGKTREGIKQKLYFHLPSGDIVSVWRCFIFDESEELPENNELAKMGVGMSHVEGQLINRLKSLVREPRDKTQLRVVLLASGGHFAGCVFDGNSIVAHKTFHRYVVRAKAGKQQSAHDAGGKVAHSAGSSLRRYNEGALKKEIQELLVTWKPYIDSSSCIFVYAPSRNRHMLFDRERPPSCAVRNVPFIVRRPTLKEAKRVYHHLTHISYEVWGKTNLDEDLPLPNERKGSKLSTEAQLDKHVGVEERASAFGSVAKCLPSNGDNVTLESLSMGEETSLSQTENESTPLHEATKLGDTQRILELLEQGTNPCIKDSRGRTPYMLATEKEVRNTFRRFMALNLDRWDWHAANVPSPLTKEMEDSQAAKQSEKDAKRKAKAKELKKLRKANEKAKAQEAAAQSACAATPRVEQAAPATSLKQQPPLRRATVSKEEEERQARAAEREMRAAAAERRMAALYPRMAATTVATPPPQPAAAPSSSSGGVNDVLCSCCNVSLAGKVPFHRYNYRYCSTSCMYVHKQMLEDE